MKTKQREKDRKRESIKCERKNVQTRIIEASSLNDIVDFVAFHYIVFNEWMNMVGDNKEHSKGSSSNLCYFFFF